MYCEIRVKGQLSPMWSAWFDGLAVANESNGEVVLTGALPDQAALYGVLDRLQALNLALISVSSMDDDAGSPASS